MSWQHCYRVELEREGEGVADNAQHPSSFVTLQYNYCKTIIEKITSTHSYPTLEKNSCRDLNWPNSVHSYLHLPTPMALACCCNALSTPATPTALQLRKKVTLLCVAVSRDTMSMCDVFSVHVRFAAAMLVYFFFMKHK